MNPRFTHDCDICTFLGQINGVDLYVCPDDGDSCSGTYLARYGGGLSEYTSGKHLVRTHPFIREAHRLATVQGIALDLGF